MVREQLESLRLALVHGGEEELATRLEDVLAADDAALDEFLVSNDLWGGSGSIADQAGMPRSADRRAIEAALIALGEHQIAAGVTNVRTAMWVEAFRQWLDQGI